MDRLANRVGLALVLSLPACAGSSDPSPRGASMTWDYRFPSAAATGPSFDDVLAQARLEGRPVLVDFHADGCAACQYMDRGAYASPAVVAEAERFVSVRVDLTVDSAEASALETRFAILSVPTVAFVSASGAILDSPRVVTAVSPEPLVATLRGVR